MTNRLVINFPNSSITIDSDKSENLNTLFDFCIEELGAYHASQNVNELTVDTLSEEQSDSFYSFAFELGLL